jgi:hypothetical protein
VKTTPFPQVTADQLLDLQLCYYDELLAYAVAHPRVWTR